MLSLVCFHIDFSYNFVFDTVFLKKGKYRGGNGIKTIYNIILQLLHADFSHHLSGFALPRVIILVMEFTC